MRVEYYEDKHDKKKDVFKFEETMYKFPEGYIPPGQYIYPFAFMLPKDCPSSTYYTGSEKSEAYVKYKCKVKFKAEDDTDIDSIKDECYLIVRQAPKAVQTNLQGSEDVDIMK